MLQEVMSSKHNYAMLIVVINNLYRYQ